MDEEGQKSWEQELAEKIIPPFDEKFSSINPKSPAWRTRVKLELAMITRYIKFLKSQNNINWVFLAPDPDSRFNFMLWRGFITYPSFPEIKLKIVVLLPSEYPVSPPRCLIEERFIKFFGLIYKRNTWEDKRTNERYVMIAHDHMGKINWNKDLGIVHFLYREVWEWFENNREKTLKEWKRLGGLSSVEIEKTGVDRSPLQTIEPTHISKSSGVISWRDFEKGISESALRRLAPDFKPHIEEPVSEEEKNILRQLEERLGIEIPQAYKINENITGYVVKDQHIVALSIFNTDAGNIPDAVFDLEHLVLLYLKQNKLVSISTKIEKLRKLQKLDLSGNQIEELPEELGNLSFLEHFYLRSNNLVSLPQNLAGMSALKYLSIGNNKLSDLGRNIGDLTSLEYLSVYDNSLTELPDDVGNLANLEYLDARNNGLNRLPGSMANLSNLNSIFLDGNNFSEFPAVLTDLKSLRIINLSDNPLAGIPVEIGSLSSLEELHLRDAKIKHLPSSMDGLKSLKRIDLSSNELLELPSSLNGLESLEMLHLFGNKLRTLPREVGSLKNLKEINISFNRLDTLPSEIGNLANLTYLYLQQNIAKELPEEINKLESLKVLNLDGNEITDLSASIDNLTALETLNLANNELIRLPDSIGTLKSLKNLNLSGNKLEFLNPEIWKLKNLEKLDLDDNEWNDEFKDLVNRDIKTLLEHCRKIANIQIFISHAVANFEEYRIKDLATYLERQKEIFNVFFCEEDLVGNIDEFMDEKLPKSQLVLFFATNKSVFHSKDCKYELDLAKKHSIEIIPVKGRDIGWSDLVSVGLSRELGLEFPANLTEENFDNFVFELYDYIKKFKRNINLFNKEEATKDKEKLKVKARILSYLESNEYDNIFAKKIREIKLLLNKLENSTITNAEFITNLGNILDSS